MEKAENRTCRILDIALRYGLFCLLGWTPLALGAVHTWAYAALEIHVWLLVAIGLFRYGVIWRQGGATATWAPRFVTTPLAWPLGLFIVVLMLQLLPLPASVLTFFSPSTSDIYQIFHPGWPEQDATLSVAPYSTKLALGQYLAYAGVFFLCVNTLRTRRDIRSICWVVVGTASVMAIVGILQDATGSKAIYWWRDASYANGRFFGPYLNRNHFAFYQTIAMMLGLGLLLSEPLKVETTTPLVWRRRLLQWLGLLTPGRLFLIIALSLMTVSVILAASRGGTLSLLLGLLCLVMLLCWRRIALKRQAVFLLGLLAMVGMIVWFGMEPLLLRFEQLAPDSQPQLWAGRLPAFQAAWRLVQDFPLFGIGYEAFPALSARYQPIVDTNVRYFHVHNDFLQLLAETGWLGFGLLVGGLLLTIGVTIRQWQRRRDPFVQIIVAAGLAALFAIGLHSLVDFNLHIPANALLFTTVLATTFTCAHLPRHRMQQGTAEQVWSDDRERSLTRWGPTALWVGFGLLAVCVLTAGSLRLVIADLMYPQAEVLQPNHWVYRAQPDASRQRLQQAMAWTPSNPWYWRQLAALEMQAARAVAPHDDGTEAMRSHALGTWQRAERAYERALRGRPTDPYLQLGWLQAKQRLTHLQKRVDSAAHPRSTEAIVTSYRQIASLAPSSPDIQYGLGLALLDAGADVVAAVSPGEFFRQAIHLEAEYDQRILQTYLRLLPEDEARRQFANVLPSTPQAHRRAAHLLEHANWRQARLHYRTAMILSGSDPTILQDFAEALMRHREFDGARDIWERLREQTLQQPEVYLGLASALRHLDEREALVQTLQQLVIRFPQKAAYQAQLARGYGRLNRIQEAEATWKRAIDLQPQDVENYVGLARLYEAQNEIADAILMMQRVVVLVPEHVGYQQALARLYENSGQRDEAVQIYQRLASYRTDDPQPFYKLGTFAQQQGHLSRAVTYYRRAVRLKPGHIGFRRALDRALEEIAKR